MLKQLLTRSNITGVVSAQSCLPLTEAVGLRTSSLLARRKRLCLSASLSSLCFLQALNNDWPLPFYFITKYRRIFQNVFYFLFEFITLFLSSLRQWSHYLKLTLLPQSSSASPFPPLWSSSPSRGQPFAPHSAPHQLSPAWSSLQVGCPVLTG